MIGFALILFLIIGFHPIAYGGNAVGTYQQDNLFYVKAGLPGKVSKVVLTMDTRTGVIEVCKSKWTAIVRQKPFKELIESNLLVCDQTLDFIKQGDNPVGTYAFQLQVIDQFKVFNFSISDTRSGDYIICENIKKIIWDGENTCSGAFNPFNESKS